MKSVQFTRFLFFALLLLGTTFTIEAQNKKPKSPPATATQTLNDLAITIDYNAPSVRGRDVWGNLVPYGKVWRTGANDATTFEVNEDVLINGQPLSAGKYALFTIPNEGEWTFIFNKVASQWGAYKYDAGEDALRITAKTNKVDEFVETMTFKVEEDGTVRFSWENLQTGFSVSSAVATK